MNVRQRLERYVVRNWPQERALPTGDWRDDVSGLWLRPIRSGKACETWGQRAANCVYHGEYAIRAAEGRLALYTITDEQGERSPDATLCLDLAWRRPTVTELLGPMNHAAREPEIHAAIRWAAHHGFCPGALPSLLQVSRETGDEAPWVFRRHPGAPRDEPNPEEDDWAAF